MAHSKLRNTGILFEILVSTITADTLAGKDSKALPILKKYFVKTELGKEYKLYETLIKQKQLTEGKANIIINAIVEGAKKLNLSTIKRQKYNLVKEISENYNLDEFFKTKLANYKVHASIYNLIENETQLSTNQIITNKSTLLEHLCNVPTSKKEVVKDVILEEFKTYDKDLRILTYKLILNKFNDKYADLNVDQKVVLKEFISAVDSAPKLKEFYNTKVSEIKVQLLKLNKKVTDKSTQIKLNETINILSPLGKNDKISNDHLVSLLQYYELLAELKTIHK